MIGERVCNKKTFDSRLCIADTPAAIQRTLRAMGSGLAQRKKRKPHWETSSASGQYSRPARQSKGGTLLESRGISAGFSNAGVASCPGMAPLTPCNPCCGSSPSVAEGTPDPLWNAGRPANKLTEHPPDPTAGEGSLVFAHPAARRRVAPQRHGAGWPSAEEVCAACLNDC